MAPKSEAVAPAHEDWSEPAEPVASWAEEGAPAAAPAAAFGAAPPAQEDWAAQVITLSTGWGKWRQTGNGRKGDV